MSEVRQLFADEQPGLDVTPTFVVQARAIAAGSIGIHAAAMRQAFQGS